MSEIKDFWNNKYNYSTTEQLLEKIAEYYRADFIENYSKWKLNVDELNKDAFQQLQEIGMPESHWQPMNYDTFCSTVIELITEWINANKDISRQNIKVILEKLFAELLARHLKVWEDNMYTMESLLKSTQKLVLIHDVK